jgi:putative oxidoreductase
MRSIFTALVDAFAGGLLVYTGLLHAFQPWRFYGTTMAYNLLPEYGASFLVLLLPYVQVVTGVCLVIGCDLVVARRCAMALYALFALAQAMVLWSGGHVACGCFGLKSEDVSVRTMSVPLALLVLLLLANGSLEMLFALRRNPSASLR